MSRVFEDWIESLDSEIGLDSDSIQYFTWLIEEEYENRFLDSLDYFSDRLELLALECRDHLLELAILESRFVETEQYEKCAAVVALQKKLKFKYRDIIPDLPVS
jgi:hypothetical protein